MGIAARKESSSVSCYRFLSPLCYVTCSLLTLDIPIKLGPVRGKLRGSQKTLAFQNFLWGVWTSSNARSTELRKKSLMVKYTLVYVALEDRCLLKICKPLYFATLSSLKKGRLGQNRVLGSLYLCAACVGSHTWAAFSITWKASLNTDSWPALHPSWVSGF